MQNFNEIFGINLENILIRNIVASAEFFSTKAFSFCFLLANFANAKGFPNQKPKLFRLCHGGGHIIRKNFSLYLQNFIFFLNLKTREQILKYAGA